jgi:hypothetical protein
VSAAGVGKGGHEMRPLETPRLIVRNFVQDDLPALSRMIGEYQASPYAAYDQ